MNLNSKQLNKIQILYSAWLAKNNKYTFRISFNLLEDFTVQNVLEYLTSLFYTSTLKLNF